MKILYRPHAYSQQRQREKKACIFPIQMAMEASYNKLIHHEVKWDPDREAYLSHFDKIIEEPEGLPFLELPKVDRVLTQAMHKRYQNNGNFKYRPGAYIMSALGCWWGKCSFCVEKENPEYWVRSVDHMIDEIRDLKLMGFREVFDDSATFPIGRWLDEFIAQIKKNNLHNSLRFGCNMRLVDIDYRALREAGFRMLLFGVESASQETLDRINKGVRIEDIIYVRKAAESGLEPHVSAIVGYPWETDAEALRTIHLIQYLLKNGYAKTAQISFYTPPEGMTIGNEAHRKYVTAHYKVAFSPMFWYNKIMDIKSIDDVTYILRAIKKGATALCQGRLT